MKQFTVALVTLGLVFSTALASARDHDHGHKNHGRHSAHHTKKKKHIQHHKVVHKKSHKKHHRSNKHVRHFDNHHVKHHGHRNHKRHHPVHHNRHYSRHHNKAGYLLGGMFLGAVINEWASPKTTVVKETVYVDRGPNYIETSQDFLLDEHGYCYRVEYQQRSRVLTEVPYDFCR